MNRLSFRLVNSDIPTTAERMPWLVVRSDGTLLAGNMTEGGARLTAERLEAFVVKRVIKPTRHRRTRRR